MDGVLASFEQGFLNLWRKLYPDRDFVPFESRRAFYLKLDYPQNYWPQIEEVYNSKGFFENLPPVEGAIKALNQIAKEGHTIKICTIPLVANPFSREEKLIWIEKHLGKQFLKDTIITADKSLFDADYLIDDRPEIKITRYPSWEQIIFDAPYNREVTNKKRLLKWSDWRGLVESS